MSSNPDKRCFEDLMQSQIRIPQIQRDYAQGREHREVKEIRNHFVRSLMHVVTGKRAEAQLDFVYGTDRDNAFEPLDGQQRLTTLFLLHWVLGVNLKTGKDEPILTYETRSTSEAFCKELVRHSAKQFVDEAYAKTEKSKEKGQKIVYTPKEIIKDRDWFQWGWRFDPTINSMLVMIDAICEQMDWTLDLAECRERLRNITFNHLDLGKMGMSDELFIKMNARGKLLSDFDKLKSTLEEEIQIQQKETSNGKALANTGIERSWREHMDGKWIDLFWQKYAGKVMSASLSGLSEKELQEEKKRRLLAAEETERRFKIFMLRMIAMQLFAKMSAPYDEVKNMLQNSQDDADRRSNEELFRQVDELYEVSYKMNESNLDNLWIAYQNQLINWRAAGINEKPSFCTTIDFEQLIDDMDLWITDDGNGLYQDVTELIPQYAYLNDDECSYFSILVGEHVGNDAIAILYSIYLFLKRYRWEKNCQEAWRKNFEEWTCLSRNIFKMDNNTDRINKRADAANAFKGISDLFNDMVTYLEASNIDLCSNEAAVLLYLRDKKTEYKGVDNKSLDEERRKAKLRLDSNGSIDKNWTDAIRKAERDSYLWGQIRCLIEWAKDDLQLFNEYADCLIKWINLDRCWPEQELFYNALLCFKPDCWKKDNRLYEFNRDRDNSVKRYLRDDGSVIREFIEEWNKWNKSATLSDFCNHIISSTNNTGWVKYFKQKPNIIWRSWRKRIFEDKGHVIFAEQKTQDSHCFDPMLLWIEACLKDEFYLEDSKAWKSDVNVEFKDSKSLGSHGLVFTILGKTCEIHWGEKDGEYIINNDGNIVSLNGADDLGQQAQKIISHYKHIYDTHIPV